MNRPADSLARERALDPTSSFAVTAPAGSGKTGLLTQRVLRLLAGCEQPEEVLCITFTRKAAGEMQDRITQAIFDSSHLPEPEDPYQRDIWQLAQAVLKRDRELGWNLLLAPNRLRIQTFDGLCRNLTQQLPLTSGLGSQPDTLDQAQSAYELAAQEFLKLLEQDSPLQSDLIRLLKHLDNNLESVEKLLIALLARRDQWLGLLLAARSQRARDYLQDVLQELINDNLAHTTDLLATWGSDLGLIADQCAQHMLISKPDSPITLCDGLTGLPENTPEAHPQWLGLIELLLKKDNDWRKQVRVGEGFPPGANKAEKEEAKSRKAQMLEIIGELKDCPGLLEQLQLVRTLPPAVYSDDQWLLLDSLTRLLPVLAAQLTLVFKSLGATDHTEITQAALQGLGDEDNPTNLALKLDYRIRHILVDEFQDTASPQLQLLQKLTAGWQDGDGRSLFIVGDGMQSCYGFRDANVGIFLDARQHGISPQLPMEALDLSVNFRSQSGVVDWVNRIFQQAFPAENDISRGAVRYADSDAFHPALTGPAVRSLACYNSSVDDSGNYLGLSPRELEAQQVCAVVQQSRAESPDDNIAILVRSRPHLSEVLKALSEAGLSWQATEIDPLASRMAIIDLISLTRALLDPADRIAWLAILRAPWCGLDLHELYEITNSPLSPRIKEQGFPVLLQQLLEQLKQPDNIANLSKFHYSEQGRHNLYRFIAIIKQAWLERSRKPLRQWLEGIWLALGGPATLTDSSDLDNCARYFELLEKHARGSHIPDWPAFQQAIDKLYAAPRHDADPKLQVMTIHKSKGLEFDTVIIPGLNRGARSNDKDLLLWQERISHSGDKQLLLGPLSATGEDNDALYSFLRQENQLKERLETTRLLYVGCTRAIKRLYLLSEHKYDEKLQDIKAPSSQSLLTSIWPTVKDEVEKIDAALQSIAGQSIAGQPEALADGPDSKPQLQAGLQHILRLSSDWQPPVLQENHSLKDYRGHEYALAEGTAEDENNLPEAESAYQRSARHTGTVLHRSLQRITLDGTELWSSNEGARLTAQRPFWKLQLQQLGVFGAEQEKAVDKIQRAIETMLQDPTGQWLLDHQHSESACELSLGSVHSGNSHHMSWRESIIDRTFIFEGERWIVDYKSSEPKMEQSQQTFLSEEVDSYRAQLERYADCLKNMGETNIRTALYFPLIQHLEEIDLEQSHDK